MRWLGYVAHMGERRNAYSVLMRKPERKRQLGRPTYRLEDIFSVLLTKHTELTIIRPKKISAIKQNIMGQ
jgi:hypothetical protein